MSSPFMKMDSSRMTNTDIGVKPIPLSGVAVSTKPSSPLMVSKPQKELSQFQSVFTLDDVESAGRSIEINSAETTNRIVKSITLNKYNELGDILARLRVQHDSLNPQSVIEATSGNRIIRWFKKQTSDLKVEMTKRLETADVAFESLTKDIEERITRSNQWIVDLDGLYQDNYQNYLSFVKEIEKLESWQTYQQEVVDNFPKIDPNSESAMMDAQKLRDEQYLLHAIELKINNLKRRKIVTENNTQVIRTQQETSRRTVSALREIMASIPDLRISFALFKQTLDTQDSINFHAGVKGLLNDSLKAGADNTHKTAVEATKALVNPIIENATLDHIRSRMTETIQSVISIEQSAKQQSIADAKWMEESQAEYLNVLQSKTPTQKPSGVIY